LNFPVHPECRACQLWELSASPGIATRPPDFQEHTQTAHDSTQNAHAKALFIIGQNPGRNEDAANRSWVGQAGGFLHGILRDMLEVEHCCDVFLANACRCRTPRDKPPNVTARKACWPWLEADLRAVIERYGAENVTVLALGAPAAWVVSGTTIKQSLLAQGARRKLFLWPNGPPLACFFTYHPASVLPGRDPSLLAPMQDHLRLLRDYLSGTLTLPALPEPPLLAPSVLPWSGGRLSLDIETYGVLEGVEQTVFHPQRMTVVDHVDRSDIIVRVGLAWENGEHIDSATYDFSRAGERFAFLSVMRSLPPDTTLLGQNLCFDLSVLLYVMPQLRSVIKLDKILLDDLMLVNHLDMDVRPERSLKSLSTVFRTMDYESLSINLKRGMKAKGYNDPNLILYNVADCIAALKNHSQCLANIEAQHGSGHPALTEFGRQFRSDLLFTVLHMTEAGHCFDTSKLSALHTHSVRKARRLDERLLFRHNTVVCGKGSERSTRLVVIASMEEAGLLRANGELTDGRTSTPTFDIDPRVKMTDEKQDISIGKDNIHLLLATLPPDAKSRPVMKMIEAQRSAAKLVSSYTTKLLTDPVQGGILRGPRVEAWSIWYPAPSHVKDSSGGEGGTRQARFSARNPAAQTYPDSVLACLTSVYGDDGVLASYDMSQEELRVAALLSGDPEMMYAYEHKIDIHLQTALVIWPTLRKTDLDYKDKREVAKHTNFLALYLGQANALVAKVRSMIGVELSLDQGRAILRAFDGKYKVFRTWQHGMLNSVAEVGFLLLPTGWKRTFLGGPDGALVSYANEIANMPIQTLAAQCVQSSQAVILRERDRRSLTFQLGIQAHDSVLIDSHFSSWQEVDRVVQYALEHSPLWARLEEMHERHVPLVAARSLLFVGRNAHAAIRR